MQSRTQKLQPQKMPLTSRHRAAAGALGFMSFSVRFLSVACLFIGRLNCLSLATSKKLLPEGCKSLLRRIAGSRSFFQCRVNANHLMASAVPGEPFAALRINKSHAKEAGQRSDRRLLTLHKRKGLGRDGASRFWQVGLRLLFRGRAICGST